MYVPTPTTVSSATTLVVNRYYIWTGSSNAALTLPATCAVGDRITVLIIGTATGLPTITKNTGQSIYFGTATSYSTSVPNAVGNASICLVCTTTNTTWNVEHFVGTFTNTP